MENTGRPPHPGPKPKVQRGITIKRQSKVCDLRIVLLGKSSSEISRVGNVILGREAFNTEAPPPSVEQHSERAGGTVKGRYITLINTPHLFDPQLSPEKLTQRVGESVSLCSPGPHVFLLVLQSENFTQHDHDRIRTILNTYSPTSMKYTVVVTTGEDHGLSFLLSLFINKNNLTQCRFEDISKFDKEEVHNLLKKIEEVSRENGGDHLTCEMNESPLMAKGEEHPTVLGKDSLNFTTKENIYSERCDGMRNWKENPKQKVFVLRMVLLGKSSSKTSSVGNFILGRDMFDTKLPPPSVGQHSERAGGTVEGRYIILINTPHLFDPHLSPEELNQRVRECASLCSPGPHVLVLVLHPDNFTEADKDRLYHILFSLSEEPHKHTLVVTTQRRQSVCSEDPVDENISQIIAECSSRHFKFSSECSRSDLLEMMEKIVEENKAAYCESEDVLAKQQQQHQQRPQRFSEQPVREKKPTSPREFNIQENCRTQKSDELRIVLLGKTGVGKSATASTILGKQDLFKEDVASGSVTTVCQKETVKIHEKHVTVIDTPGLFDTSINNEEIKKEIAKCITMAAPGPHVFLLVLSLGQRFTQEEKEAVKRIQDQFGEESRKYTMVLFTRGDDLRKTSIKNYIKDSDCSLQNIIYQCGDRYHVINNRKHEDRTQVSALLEKIEHMVAVNGGSCYTNEMFLEVEKALQEEQERILKEREEEIEREKEELRAKHEAELEKMKKTMEEEQQKQDEERKEREREFREREEQIKRESAERERIERENYNRRREEDEKIMKEWMAEINREREENRKQWEKQREEDQRRRDQEEEERRKKEDEWKKNQRAEKEKFEREKEDMKNNEKQALMKLQQEYDQKAADEEKRQRDLEEKIKQTEESIKELLELQITQRREWERKEQEEERRRRDLEERIKQTEESKRKELLELQITQQREWESMKEEEERRRGDLKERIKNVEESKKKELLKLQITQQKKRERMKQEEKMKREEQEKQWRERMEFKEREWELQQNHKQQQYELERQLQMERKDLEEEKRKQREEEEKRRIEREANEKIRQMEEQLKTQRERKEKERREIVEQHMKEMEQLQRQQEAFRREREEEEKKQKEDEQRNLDSLRKNHAKEMEILKIQTELTARKQAEEEFCAKLDQKIKEAKEEGFKEGHEKGIEEGHGKGIEEGREKGIEEGRKKGIEEGHEKGIEEGREKGIEEGRKKGIEEGHEKGIEEGREKGIEEGRKKGIEEGHEKGIKEGRIKGIKEGRIKGIKEGREKGMEEGHERGIEMGRKKGIEEGRKKGIEEGRKKGIEEGRAETESERTKPGRVVDAFVNFFKK